MPVMHNNNEPLLHNNNVQNNSISQTPVNCTDQDHSKFDEHPTQSSTKSQKDDEHGDSDTFNWPSDAERAKEEQSHSATLELLPDQFLTSLGCSNTFMLFIWITAATCWALAAMPVMVSTFLMQIPCPNGTTTGRSTTPKTAEEQCRKPETCDKLKGTLTEEFDLPINEGGSIFTFNIPELSTTLFLSGIVAGSLITPRLADRIGRQPILCFSLIMSGVFGCLSAAVTHVSMFLVFRFLQGGCFPGVSITNWVLAYESISHRLRSYTTLIFGLCWVVGYCLIGPMAYLLPNWRWLSFAASLPALIFGFVYLCIMPESLHWLTANGEENEIQEWVDRANRYSRKIIRRGSIRIRRYSLRQIGGGCDPRRLETDSHSTTTMPSRVKRVLALGDCFRYYTLKCLVCIYTTIFAYLWLCNTFIYYGLSLFSTKLVGDIYWNYVFVGLAEIPSYVVSPFLLDKMGRRIFVATAHFIGASTYFVIAFNDSVPKCPLESITLGMWLLGKFAISCSFTSLFVYASEVFPTTSRNTSIGICAAFSRIGATLVPIVSQMPRGLQLSVFGGTALVAGLLTLLLPETKNGDLPESSDEVPKTKTLTLTQNPKKRVQLKS